MVYNVNEGAGCSLLEKSPTLMQYSQLVALIRSYQTKGPVTNQTMQEIVKICLQKGILVDVMKEHGKSLIDCLHFELTHEEALEFFREDGFEAGITKGAADMQSRLNKLNTLLLNAGRLDDLKKSLNDTEYQQSLFEEFNI